MRPTTFLRLVSSVFVLFLLGACSHLPSLSFGDKAIDPDKLPATIRVGLATDAPPLSYRDATAVRGLDAKLAAGLKSYSKRKVLYVPLARKDLLTALQHNQVDVAMAAFTASEIEHAQLAATTGYLHSGLMPLMLLGQQKRLSSETGLKAANVRIGTVQGSSGPAYVRALKTRGTHQMFPSTQAGVDALLRQRIDVLICDMPACFHYASLHIEQGLTPGTRALTRDNLVWALRPEDRDLRLMLDRYLQEREANGSLTALISSSLPFYDASLFHQ